MTSEFGLKIVAKQGVFVARGGGGFVALDGIDGESMNAPIAKARGPAGVHICKRTIIVFF